MSDEKERLVAEIPEDLKALIDADQRTNREIVEAALWREFGGTRMGAIERRIEEKKQRISMLESERNERSRELEDEQSELEALKAKKENQEDAELVERQEKLRQLHRVPDDPSHPLVKDVAEELGISPETALEEADGL